MSNVGIRDDAVDVGVIGVGSMGEHHARVYNELPDTRLVGVSDADRASAETVATSYATDVLSKETLLKEVDAVSLVVPTESHFDEAVSCFEQDVGVLIEKPVVGDPDRGWELARYAAMADVPVQVGHIERFNPAVSAVAEIIPDMDIISVRAERLGPPPDRQISDSAVIDLMIHDLDIVRSLLGEEPETIASAGVNENRHATALLEFESDVIATLTASRMTQRKVRRLEITTTDCLIEVDYINQSIDIHRHSVPEFIEDNGDVRYRHESIIERPTITNEEPLKAELRAFAGAVRDGTEPEVTIEDGIRALDLAQRIEDKATERPASKSVLSHD